MGMSDSAIKGCGMFVLADPPARTNADRIRQMTDEELAEWYMKSVTSASCFIAAKHGACVHPSSPCKDCIVEWLKSPEG